MATTAGNSARAECAQVPPASVQSRHFAHPGQFPWAMDVAVIGVLKRVTIRRILTFAVAMLAALSAFRAEHVIAQAVTPSAEQLEILRSLSPEQRDALLRQLAGGSDSAGGGGGRDRDRDQNRRNEGRAQTQDEAFQRQLGEEEEREPKEPRLKSDDTVIIKIDVPKTQPGTDPQLAILEQERANGADGTPPVIVARPPTRTSQRVVELTEEERVRRQRLIELIRSRNPYRLSSDGSLNLPGFAPIPLGGLTEMQATMRLQSHVDLQGFDVGLIYLPLTKTGIEALKPFGYNLFESAPSTFAPVTNVPVPSDYVVGPGDEFNIQLYGNQNRNLQLVVGRDGRINFPELGPIDVGGQLFSSVRNNIEARVQREMIGVRASLSMGDTRSIRVFVLGEAKRAGSYTISGLGTITSALFAAGGVKPIGSLRDIQLKRRGEIVRRLDLYDMLINGDTTDDAKLLPGDVVFVPTIGPTVTVSGEVKRAAIYEVSPTTTADEAIRLAGGLTPEADSSRVALSRIESGGGRKVFTINLSNAATSRQPVMSGDQLQVFRQRPTLESGVTVGGHVHTPVTYAFTEGMRLSDVIRSVDELKPNADIHYLIIRRELPPNRQTAVLSADLDAALRNPGTPADALLMPRDRIMVFDLEPGRDRIIRPILEELRLQSTIERPTEVVSIDGRVKAPGQYPLEPGMRVSDLIRAGGALSDAAYGGTAELTRYRVVDGESRRTQLIDVDLAAVIRGDQAADIVLEPFDSLSIREVPEWGEQEYVTLVGEIRFPGRYSIKRGETLRSVMTRAGGLTEFAFPEGSVFTRDELKEREQRQLDQLADRVQNDLVTLALQGAAASNQAQAGSALTIGQSLLAQIRTSQAVGRLVINLPMALRVSSADIILRNGDRLMIPKYQQEVSVIGEVQTVTSHLYGPELTRDDYIALSGGVTRRADRDKIYVVRADGSVVAEGGARWFSRGGVDIKPGDTIVVPLDTERMPPLPFWQAVTQIIYYLAVSTAAVNSF
jgi:protein involved in polysaccharide export with SLBB domain